MLYVCVYEGYVIDWGRARWEGGADCFGVVAGLL